MNTRESIMSLTPDQLRVEIAKALGYPYPYDKYMVAIPKPIMFVPPLDAQPIPDFRTEYKDVPDWPNSIEAAWKLVEEMNTPVSYFHIWWVPENQYWIAEVNKIQVKEYEVIEGKAETAPLAISRAWMIWNEERKEK